MSQSQNKVYYWIKLYTDFFDDISIKRLRKIAGGAEFTIIYLKLMLLATKHTLEEDVGVLYYEGYEETFAEELALKINEEPDNVAVTLNYLLQHNLLEQHGDGNLEFPKMSKYVGKETKNAETMRLRRAEEKAAIGDNSIKKIGSPEKNTQEEKYGKDFTEWWEVYPRQVDKGHAFSNYKARCKEFPPEQLLLAAKNYSSVCKKNRTEKQYIKHPATFLSAALPFTDYLPKLETKPKPKEGANPFEDSIED